MAVVTTEQARLWRPDDGTDSDSLAGDGSAMHSLLLHDIVRANNAIFTRCEPQLGFAFDASTGLASAVGLGGRSQTRWNRFDSSIPSSGVAFLAQMPIVVPQGATRLVTSVGFDRYSPSGPDVGTIAIDVTALQLYLSPVPLSLLHTFVRFPTDGYDLVGNFSVNSFVRYKAHQVSVSATSGSASYTLAVDSTWTDFHVEGGDGPIAWLIVGMTYTGADVGESIYLRDFSCWGEWDESNRFITLFDDSKLALCRNGTGATGKIARDMYAGFVKNACRPRPIYNCWGGTDKINNDSLLRQMWLNVNPGSNGLSSRFLGVSSTGAVPSTNQGVLWQVGSFYSDTSYDTSLTVDARNPYRYPFNSHMITPQRDILPEDDGGGGHTKGSGYETRIGSSTSNGPQVRSACLFETQNVEPTNDLADAPQTPFLDWLARGQLIVGTENSDLRVRSVRAVRDYFRRVFKGRRWHIGWSGINDTAPYEGWIKIPFATYGNNYRYLFNLAYGQGGTAPTISGPGCTIPGLYAAAGLRTTYRVYTSVYARQTGGGTGTIATYTRNANGTTMTGPTALSNGLAITSSTWAWYGVSAPFVESGDPFFNANATLAYDRVLLCGKCTAGELDIGAWSMAAYHSTQ